MTYSLCNADTIYKTDKKWQGENLMNTCLIISWLNWQIAFLLLLHKRMESFSQIIWLVKI